MDGLFYLKVAGFRGPRQPDKEFSEIELNKAYKEYNNMNVNEEFDYLESIGKAAGFPFFGDYSDDDDDFENKLLVKHNELLFNLWGSIGVLCLSGNKNDILMWSHYANSHQGVLIEIE